MFCLYVLLAGTYYTSFTNFIQGYIDNEINLNGEQTCGGTCSDYKSTKNHQCQYYTICDHSNFIRTRCTGDIFDCSTIDSDGVACLVVRIQLNAMLILSPFYHFISMHPFPCCYFINYCNCIGILLV